MKDANGSRFQLLLGEADWGRCEFMAGDGAWQPLGPAWQAGDTTVPLVYERERQSLCLAPRIARFRAAPSDTPADASKRLGAAADAFGNVYWIADGGARIDVLGSGSRTVAVHSLANPPAAAVARGDFAPAAVVPPARHASLRGLAVTAEHYLVAGVRAQPGEASGLQVFDLVAGGAALPLSWPTAWPFEPHDLAPRPCGGLAVLDRMHRRVWLLDRRLGMRAVFPVQADDATGPDDFAPLTGAVPAPMPPPRAPWFDLAVDGQGGADPVAVEVLADDAVLVMDAAGPDGFALLSLYVDGTLRARSSTRVVLDVMDPDEREGFTLRGHDMALAPVAEGQPERLVIAAQDGNQCLAFDLLRDAGGLRLQPLRLFLPMRRFASKGLVRRRPDGGSRLAEDTGLLYDGLGTWLPLVAEKRPRYGHEAALQTPPLDGAEPACVWHRVLFDGCVPPGSHVRIESRAADSLQALADQPYRAEPEPVLRPDGSELPWLLEGPTVRTDAALGRGAWELLLQRAHGRYLQLRVTVQSADELATPCLAALRAWSPRFSYAARYLPAVYREDEASADFLERFLANFEGVFTTLEDRIATASALFDVRSAPADTLDWLAGWLGLVLDPAVDESRRRLLIRFAMPLYQYRGTVQGLRLAAELVLSRCVRPEDFVLPARSQQQPFGVRIVERYLTRRLPPALLGETVLDAPRLVATGPRWTPAEGRDGLDRRYRAALQAAGVAGAETAQFEAVPVIDPADTWRAFCADQLGAVPQLAVTLQARWAAYIAALPEAQREGLGTSLPRQWPDAAGAQALWRDFVTLRLPPELRRWLARWQAFLARRYQRIDTFTRAWGTSWPEFGLVPAPQSLPSAPAALADWLLFETRLEPMALAAHRFSVLLPSSGPLADAQALAQHIDWARRVVGLEKPAHTVFEVRPYWAMFRIGSARLGLDSLLGSGSRAPELAPAWVVGVGHVGASRVALATRAPRDRLPLPC
jgi:phage tail-like protein